MRKAIWLTPLLLVGALAAPTPNYAGSWSFTAEGDDGTIIEQAANVKQFTRSGKVFLTGGGFTVPLVNNVVSYSTTRKDADATRTYSFRLVLRGSTASGSGIVRETYKNGQVLVTRFTVKGKR